MSLPPYINIHTHSQSVCDRKETLLVLNKYEDFDLAKEDSLYSMGVHPWYISQPEQQLEQLAHAAHAKNVIAIGECGLDTLSQVDFSVQQQVFRQQISLANELDKPLIIHCVRAFSEALFLLKAARVPVVFHGFNKKLSLARQVLEEGYSFSFGAAILSSQSMAAKVLEAIAESRFFLETDDGDTDIAEIYKAAARIRKTEEEAIILQVQSNFKKVFYR